MLETLQRKKLETVLLSAGIMYPLSNAERWQAFLSGEDSLPLAVLGMDSLSINELSISIEVRCGIKLSPAALSEFVTAEALSLHIGAGTHPAEKTTEVDSFWKQRLPGKVARRLNLAIGDLIATATPLEFLELAGGKVEHNCAKLFKYRALRAAIGLLKRTSISSFHSEHIDQIRQIFLDSGLTLDPADWSRKRVRKDVLIYRQRNKAEVASCLIVFGGGRRMPMMPMSLLLAGMKNLSDTVIFVRTNQNLGFRNGISGLGADIESAFTNLVKLVYEQVPEKDRENQPPVVLGTSSGGLPALIFSHYLPVGSVVLAGPNSSRDPRWANNSHLTHALKSRYLQAQEGRAAPLTIVYGGIGNDSHFVPVWLSDIPEAQVVEISRAGHVCLPLLIQEGTFLTFFENWTKQHPSQKNDF